MKNNLTKRNYTIIELLVSLMVMLGPTLLIIIYGYMREPVTDYDLIGFAMAGLLNVLFACTGLVLYLIFVRINIISILVGLILFCLALGSPFISLSIHDERVVKYENLRLQDITPIVEDLLLRDVRAEKVEVFFSTTEPFKFLEIKEDVVFFRYDHGYAPDCKGVAYSPEGNRPGFTEECKDIVTWEPIQNDWYSWSAYNE
ncbi:hypothetical protein CL684_03015 [Candidatus Campbellbacteria bacterium]|nr:hypothetical protein [Candidatus Campbellbacteria bacterium]|tara:strand:- start:1760 stop:2362 length:603 start_codon:yes stop_codon:yes gene_type:complete